MSSAMYALFIDMDVARAEEGNGEICRERIFIP